MAEVIVRVIYEGQTYDLDIKEDIPLRLDVSAVESQNIGAFYGVGSQTFSLPGTQTNNQFFRHAYVVGADDVPALYTSIPGYVISNGETLLQGQFQLQQVLTDEDGYVTYECTLSDTVVTFKDNIQSQLLSDCDWSAYIHTLTNENVVSSWNESLVSGSIFYPLVDFGTDNPEEFPGLPRVQLGQSGSANSGDINSTTTPMRLKQFLPAIKAKDVINNIFNTAGYIATGSFMDSQLFDQVYILPKAQEGLGIAGSTGSLNTALAYPNANIIIPKTNSTTNGISQTLGFTNEQYDYNNNFSSSLVGAGFYTSSYTTPIDGDYTFTSTISFLNPSNSGTAATITLFLTEGDPVNPLNASTKYSTELTLTPSDPLGPYILTTGGVFADVPSNTQLRASVNIKKAGTSGAGVFTEDLTVLASGTQFLVSEAPITYNGATVDMGLQFDASTKSIDILKGLIEQFNLVMVPSRTSPFAIEIETFDEWMWKGELKDWTEKYNTATRIGISHTVNEQNRELLLGNQEDSDRLSILSQESAPNYPYGTLRILSDSNIPQGSKKIGSYFGSTILAGQLQSGSFDQEGNPTYNIDTNSTFVFPHLYKFENRTQQSFKFKPRIGFKVTNQFPLASPTSSLQQYVNVGLPGDFVIATGSYATLSNVDELPVTGSANDLHNNNSYTSYGAASLNLQGATSNYDTYWKNYIDSLYWEGSRKVTMDVKFNQYEYKDIKLNDRIFIKDQQYRINKISGFNVTSDDVVTVELIRLFPAYVNAPDVISCGFDVTGQYNIGEPTPVPVPIPVPAPTVPQPVPAPVVPQPVPAPVVIPIPVPIPVPQPIAPTPAPTAPCTEWELFCPSSANFGCYFDIACCDGSTLLNVLIPADSTCYYCATEAVAKFASGVATDTEDVCTDDCLIGCN
jgi:hypothetical protein